MKFVHVAERGGVGEVAPHWGAWIEMRLRTVAAPLVTVAPHWGAWIEIDRPRGLTP